MNPINLGIVGATGMVGRAFLQVLEEQNLPIDNYYLFASERSAGKQVNFMGKTYTIIELTKDVFKKYNLTYALFSAGGNISLEFAPIAKESGCIVIDNSSAWRMDETVPLIVPEVNPKEAYKNNGIIANPNCSTIQAVIPLKPLHDKYKIKRIIYTTFQAVSGAGHQGYMDLEEGLKGNPPKKFPHPIAGNVLPHIDSFLENGYTKEEMKMINETRKILQDNEIKITATTVRVPVFNSHSEAINIEFEKDFDLQTLKNDLKNFKGIIVLDEPSTNTYPLPIDVSGHDEVFVGRIRRDESIKSGINIWVVADNIRKGAATNAIQILELLLNKKYPQK